MAKRYHLIIDFQYLFHRHLYSIRQAEEEELMLGYRKTRKKLSWVVDGEEVDTTRVYFPLHDLESIRQHWEGMCDELVISVCMDSRSERKSENSEYKSNRKGLDDKDFDALKRIEEALRTCGYNIFKADGLEADDFVGSLVAKFKNDFDFTVVYTPDSDLLCHLDDNVGVMRYKSALAHANKYKGVNASHVPVSKNNFTDVMSAELKCEMPYNAIILYKCTVGDKSDGIKGIVGFGNAAFGNMISYFREKGIDFSKLNECENVKKLLEDNVAYFGSGKVAQALDALKLVECRFTEVGDTAPVKADSIEKRELAYMKYGMQSLIK